tara:strand:+ start:734 stop:1435 length:702 start_codon:yes stop_codon:yes gene_type:complete
MKKYYFILFIFTLNFGYLFGQNKSVLENFFDYNISYINLKEYEVGCFDVYRNATVDTTISNVKTLSKLQGCLKTELTADVNNEISLKDLNYDKNDLDEFLKTQYPATDENGEPDSVSSIYVLKFPEIILSATDSNSNFKELKFTKGFEQSGMYYGIIEIVNLKNDTLLLNTDDLHQPFNLPWRITTGGTEIESYNIGITICLMQLFGEKFATFENEKRILLNEKLLYKLKLNN